MRSMAEAAICVEHGMKLVQLANWCMSYHKAVKSVDGGYRECATSEHEWRLWVFE
jgi:hypothetical protein